jgi:insertion element IS1 protein InsB
MKYLLTLKKQQRAVIWTAYSRNQGRVISYYIGEGLRAPTNLYLQVKNIIPNILKICTDANSCYDIAFKRFGVTEPHIITKKETHLIESSNSSIRDNLARFNRKTKRFSKTLEMLDTTLKLFFNRNLL